MIKKEQSIKQRKTIFRNPSNLHRFINKYEDQFNKLTETEVEVLILIAKGFKNPAISVKMKTSRSTVQNHRNSIRKKLSVNSQADYIKYALAFGLVAF